MRPPFCLLRWLEKLCHRWPNDNQIDAEGTYHSHNHLFKMRSRLLLLQIVSLKKKFVLLVQLKKKLAFFVLQLYSGCGIYAGFKGAKKLISIKDEYRELENDGNFQLITSITKVCYYKGLFFSL